MYHICFDVDVKSLGYKTKKQCNSKASAAVTIGRISCRCGDGSVFCFLTHNYIRSTLESETELNLTSSNSYTYLYKRIYKIQVGNSSEKSTIASCHCGEGSVLRTSLLHPTTNTNNNNSCWKIIIIPYFLYYVHRVSAYAPLPTTKRHILIINTSIYDGLIK